MSRSPREYHILGIETSTLPGEISLATETQTIASIRLPDQRRATATLVPSIQRLCREAGWPLRGLDLVCVDIGPGSFTGLRVGITCAKMLAYASGADLATVRSVDVVAANATVDGPIAVALDAARGQVFTCGYRRHPETGWWKPVEEIRILDARAWADSLAVDATVLGPALVKYRAVVPSHISVAEESQWWPRAEQVIRLVRQQSPRQLETNFSALEPLYFRLSAAEEKKQEPLTGPPPHPHDQKK